jgi:uncharacterized protein YcfJ
MKKLVFCAAVLSLVCVPLAAEAAPKSRPAQSCKVVAKRAADNAGNGRILTTAVFGGMSGLVIGSILSENNPKGEKRAGGLFGGGLIGGKGYKVQWQRDYKKAYAACVR